MLATAPVLLVRLASWSVPAPVTALLLAGAVITSAWVGGLVPGLLSTVLTGLLVLPSGLSPELGAASPAGRLALPVLFLALATGVSIAAGARKRGEAGRRESEARLRALLGSDTIGIACCDREAVKEANDAFLRLMGYTRQTLDAGGFRWRETAPEARYLDELRLRELIATGRCTPFEKEHVRPDGSIVTLLVGGALLERQPLRWMCLVMDLTEAKKLPQVGQLLAAELDVRTIAQRATDAATRLTGARFGAFFAGEVDARGHHALHALSGAPREVFGRVGLPRSTALLASTLAGKQVVRLDDASKDSRYGRTAPHFGLPRGHLPVRSYLAVPVISRTGAAHGALLLGHPEPAAFAERDERIVVELARHAAVALDNAHLHSALEDALREEQVARTAVSERTRLEALAAEVGTTLTLAEDRRAVLQRCAEAMVRHLEAGLARIWTVGEADRLDLLASAGLSSPRLDGGDARLPVGRSEIDLIVEQRRPVVIDRVYDDPRIRDPEWARQEGMAAFAGYPLKIDDRLLGVMAVFARAPFSAATGERMAAIAATIARDLERRHREDERSERLAREGEVRAAAEAASASREEFLTMLGHELRHPLAAIRGVLAACGDDEHRVPMLDIARRQVDQVADLVDHLRDLVDVTQGAVELHRERVSLARVVERGVKRARPPLEEGDPVLSLSLPPERIELDADPARLEQMVASLLESVARDSEPGSRIEILVEREGEEAVLRVRNHDMTAGGPLALGLGPSVVRKLVELHGGRVEMPGSAPGLAPDVVVRLPALPCAEVEREREVGRARVLLVDDNHDAANGLATLLGLLGHEVQVVHDGPTALAAARSNTPDVALVDIGLPGMDGYAVAQRLRERSGKKVMLVALTGFGSEEDRKRAQAAGFDHHLVKPVDLDALEGLVAELGAGMSGRDRPSSLH